MKLFFGMPKLLSKTVSLKTLGLKKPGQVISTCGMSGTNCLFIARLLLHGIGSALMQRALPGPHERYRLLSHEFVPEVLEDARAV
jgi:hypothetical protein